MFLVRILIAFLMCTTIFTQISAAQTTLSEAKEQRARALFLELRCVVCQNQSIASSDADVAKDLREIVREKIAAGNTDDQVVQFLVARYGEFILLKPVFSWHTFALWISPFVVLLAGLAIAIRARTSSRSNSVEPLSAEEKYKLDTILQKGEEIQVPDKEENNRSN